MKSEKPKLVVEVRDSGVGIKTEDQHKLFKMFASLKSTRQMNTKGVGLGLYICKQIVEQFEGSICVESTPGVGTSFFFSFGIEKAEMVEARKAKSVHLSSESFNFEIESASAQVDNLNMSFLGENMLNMSHLHDMTLEEF